MGKYGGGAGEFDCPMGIAVDDNNEIFVVDCYNYRIQAFRLDGTFLRQWGSKGEKEGQFRSSPFGIVLNDDQVLVIDSSPCIHLFDRSGAFISRWQPEVGEKEMQMDEPFGIAVADGVLYITDWAGKRIQAFQ